MREGERERERDCVSYRKRATCLDDDDDDDDDDKFEIPYAQNQPLLCVNSLSNNGSLLNNGSDEIQQHFKLLR